MGILCSLVGWCSAAETVGTLVSGLWSEGKDKVAQRALAQFDAISSALKDAREEGQDIEVDINRTVYTEISVPKHLEARREALLRGFKMRMQEWSPSFTDMTYFASKGDKVPRFMIRTKIEGDENQCSIMAERLDFFTQTVRVYQRDVTVGGRLLVCNFDAIQRYLPSVAEHIGQDVKPMPQPDVEE